MNAPAPPLLPVADALAQILATATQPLETEHVPLSAALNRTLAADLVATRTQPPFAASAMDGYAVAAAALGACTARLHVVGVSSAGHRYTGRLGDGEAVRIFTGAPLPAGADTVIIQENTTADDDHVVIHQSETTGRHVRQAGLDFSAGERLIDRGTRLGPRHLALAAAMNHAVVPVVRRPRVAILATGDELVLPGQPTNDDQIVASNSFALAAMVVEVGGEPIDLGVAGDSFEALGAGIERARAVHADILVTIGGASVGDHDLVQPALARSGMEMGFWKIAMRPGKPLMHGRLGSMRFLGLPGNPVSAVVCGLLFLIPLIRALLGDPRAGTDCSEAAALGCDLPTNDKRQDYLRATIAKNPAAALPTVTPLRKQDSSMLRYLAEADCLIVRAPFAPAAAQGDVCRIIRFDDRQR